MWKHCVHIWAYRHCEWLACIYKHVCVCLCVCTVWSPPEAEASQGRRAANMDQLCFYALLFPLLFSLKATKKILQHRFRSYFPPKWVERMASPSVLLWFPLFPPSANPPLVSLTANIPPSSTTLLLASAPGLVAVTHNAERGDSWLLQLQSCLLYSVSHQCNQDAFGHVWIATASRDPSQRVGSTSAMAAA